LASKKACLLSEAVLLLTGSEVAVLGVQVPTIEKSISEAWVDWILVLLKGIVPMLKESKRIKRKPPAVAWGETTCRSDFAPVAPIGNSRLVPALQRGVSRAAVDVPYCNGSASYVFLRSLMG